MKYIVETSHDSEDNTMYEPPRFYGFFSFKESANHAGSLLTAKNGPEADRMFAVQEVNSTGPDSLAQWLQLVIPEIERQYGAYYHVTADTFLDFAGGDPDCDYDERAVAAYKGAKLAMQLLQVK